MEQTTDTNFYNRFNDYFSKDIANEAAKTLADGVEIEFLIQDPESNEPTEKFTFTRQNKKNTLINAAANSPHICFILPPKGAVEILESKTNTIGDIGIDILKKLKLKAGFLTFMTKGYLGVIKTGGKAFASFLASKGLGGVSAIKNLLKNK